MWLNAGKGGTPRSRNQGWWTEEVANEVREKQEAWKMTPNDLDTEGSNHPPA